MPDRAAWEIVVCAPETMQRLPLPEERERTPRSRQAINEPRAALENRGSPCAISGCPVGVGFDVIAAGKAVVEEVGHAVKRKHPGRREPIPLD